MISLSNKQHWLIELASKYPNQNAIRTGNKIISYKEFSEKCLTVSLHLKNNGIKKNNNVGILFGHKYEFFILINALWFIGAIPVPLNTRNTLNEIEQQIRHSDIKFLIIEKKLESPYKKLNFRKKLIWRNLQSNKSPSSLMKSKILTNNYSILNSALIMFTSGSSGKPKAVVHTFNGLLESVKAFNSFNTLSKNDIWLASLPFYHIGGFMILCRSLISGSIVAYPESLKVDGIIKTINQSKVNYLSLVSPTLQQLLERKVKPNEKINSVFLGGGPVDDNLVLNAIMNGWPIVKVYGSTETCSMVTALCSQNILAGNTSVGKPLAKIKIKIKSKNKKNNVGEIVVRSNSLFKKYYNDQLTTNKVLKSNWYYTGDFGRIDKKGYLFIDSRREDLIISGGENVNTKDLESVIKSIPQIRDVFVFGVKDKKWGQKVCAIVVAKNISEIEIKENLKTKIADYKIPKEIYLLKNIPRNEMGKVNPKQLLENLKLDFS